MELIMLQFYSQGKWGYIFLTFAFNVYVSDLALEKNRVGARYVKIYSKHEEREYIFLSSLHLLSLFLMYILL